MFDLGAVPRTHVQQILPEIYFFGEKSGPAASICAYFRILTIVSKYAKFASKFQSYLVF
jgi:hypothetical protein